MIGFATTLAEWFNFILGTPGAQDPITGKINVRDCAGMSATDCQDLLEEDGFSDVRVATVADWSTVTGNGPGVVVQVGVAVDYDGPIAG